MKANQPLAFNQNLLEKLRTLLVSPLVVMRYLRLLALKPNMVRLASKFAILTRPERPTLIQPTAASFRL